MTEVFICIFANTSIATGPIPIKLWTLTDSQTPFSCKNQTTHHPTLLVQCATHPQRLHRHFHHHWHQKVSVSPQVWSLSSPTSSLFQSSTSDKYLSLKLSNNLSKPYGSKSSVEVMPSAIAAIAYFDNPSFKTVKISVKLYWAIINDCCYWIANSFAMTTVYNKWLHVVDNYE